MNKKPMENSRLINITIFHEENFGSTVNFKHSKTLNKG